MSNISKKLYIYHQGHNFHWGIKSPQLSDILSFLSIHFNYPLKLPIECPLTIQPPLYTLENAAVMYAVFNCNEVDIYFPGFWSQAPYKLSLLSDWWNSLGRYLRGSLQTSPRAEKPPKPPLHVENEFWLVEQNKRLEDITLSFEKLCRILLHFRDLEKLIKIIIWRITDN